MVKLAKICLFVGLLFCFYGINEIITLNCQVGSQNQFKCKDGLNFCINIHRKCDGKFDCFDHSDEIDCENGTNSCSKPEWFLCKNSGKCISSGFLCDYKNDCNDFSDEKYCNYTQKTQIRKCSDSEWTCHNQNCINLLWVCNSENDCGDNSDETAGCNDASAHCNGFKCQDGTCIGKEKHCDQANDCQDGSDELYCTYHSPIENCTIANGLAPCNDSKSCVQLNQLCDGILQCQDKSDEGKRCTEPLSCLNCPRCIATPKGPKCVCASGFVYDDQLKKCIDIDECEQNEFICDHTCTNTVGSFVCSCAKGYYLMLDKTTCKATGDAFMVFALHNELRAYFLREKTYFSITKFLKQAVGLDADDDFVYWTDVHESQVSIMKATHTGNKPTRIVTAGLNAPEDLAVDWITGNIYFTDSGSSHIAVCSKNGLYCTVLIKNTIETPRGIALDPKTAVMFWSEWSKKPCICQATMDGKILKPLVSMNIKWPNGLAIDYPSNRLYWVDARLNVIESIRLDGSRRNMVLGDIPKHPYGVAVFENRLYWSDWKSKSIESCDKITGGNKKTLIKSPGNSIFDLHIHYSSMKQNYSNPCWSSQCHELCLLNRENNYTCMCSEESVLAVDRHSCIKKHLSNFIIVASRNYLLKFYHKHLGNLNIGKVVTNIDNINAIAYDCVNDNLYVSDRTSKSIYHVNTISGETKIVTKKEVGEVLQMGVDYLGNNLYWISVNSKSIKIVSLSTYAQTEITPVQHQPIGLALAPQENLMYVVYKKYGDAPFIDRMTMSGANVSHFIEQGLIGSNVTLHYDRFSKRIYWADRVTESIDSSSLDGSERQAFPFASSPVSIAVDKNVLLWTSYKSSFLYWRGNNVNHKINLNTPSSVNKLHLVISNKENSPITYPCAYNNGNCSHICLVGIRSHECACPPDHKLHTDYHTCLKTVKCDTYTDFFCQDTNACIPKNLVCDGVKNCEHGEDENDCLKLYDVSCLHKDAFKCDSGSCILKKFVCNRLVDCEDQSDERNCDHVKNNSKCRSDQFQCENDRERCYDMIHHCDGLEDCTDGSDENYCFSSKCESFEFRCLTNGVCIDESWVCDGDIDCDDGSDEHENCSRSYFNCDNGKRIDSHSKCNGWNDCGDNSDEMNCHTCFGTHQFQCNNTFCIPLSKKCDGVTDCPNENDEINCFSCLENEFKCNSGSACILNDWLCDKQHDCEDGSDEDPPFCSNRSSLADFSQKHLNRIFVPCSQGYMCRNGHCIDWKYVCDGKNTCLDGSDEGTDCHIMCSSKSNCSQLCKSSPRGPICSCENGYELDSDEVSCKDIDECKQNYCSQICTNLIGSFKCSCYENYTLKSNKALCKHIGPQPTLLLSHEGKIYEFSLEFQKIKTIFNHSLQIKSMAIDQENKEIYLITTMNYLICLNVTSNETKEMLFQMENRLSVIEIDYVRHTMYIIVESNDASELKVCIFGTNKCSVVLRTKKWDKLTAFAIDSVNEIMFYATTTWHDFDEAYSQIYKANLDGTHIRLLAKNKLVHVQHLRVDPNRMRVYFIDILSRSLSYVDYNGQERKLLQSYNVNEIQDFQFFDDSVWILDIFGDVRKCRVYGRSEKCKLYRMDSIKSQNFLIKHLVMQPHQSNVSYKNWCNTANNCSHFCISYNGKIHCLCEDGSVEGADRVCLINNKIQDSNRKVEVAIQLEKKTGQKKQSTSSNNSVRSPSSLMDMFLAVAVLWLSLCVFAYVYFKIFRRTRYSTFRNNIRMRFHNFRNSQDPVCIVDSRVDRLPRHEFINPCADSD